MGLGGAVFLFQQLYKPMQARVQDNHRGKVLKPDVTADHAAACWARRQPLMSPFGQEGVCAAVKHWTQTHTYKLEIENCQFTFVHSCV